MAHHIGLPRSDFTRSCTSGNEACMNGMYTSTVPLAQRHRRTTIHLQVLPKTRDRTTSYNANSTNITSTSSPLSTSSKPADGYRQRTILSLSQTRPSRPPKRRWNRPKTSKLPYPTQTPLVYLAQAQVGFSGKPAVPSSGGADGRIRHAHRPGRPRHLLLVHRRSK